MKKIWIGSDHAGFELKQALMEMLGSQFAWEDLGCFSKDSVDYPDYANLVAEKIENVPFEKGFGILICGSGQGMAMRANKYSWVRAALVYSPETAQLSREHNDANVLCLGARFMTEKTAAQLIEIFAKTTFAGGRHSQRVDKLSKPSQ